MPLSSSAINATPPSHCVIRHSSAGPHHHIIGFHQLPPSPLAHDAPLVHCQSRHRLLSAAGQATSCPRFHHLSYTTVALSLSHPPSSPLVFRRCPILWLIGKSELGHWSSPLIHQGRATSCLHFQSLLSTTVILSHPPPLPLVSSRLLRLPYLMARGSGEKNVIFSIRL